MKATLAILAFTLLAASLEAESVSFNEIAMFVIPDGSTITSMQLIQTERNGIAQDDEITFSFLDGTGTVFGDYIYGLNGVINFTVPVSSLTYTYSFVANDFAINGVWCGTECASSGTTTVSGPISSISWSTSDGYGGIDRMSYVVDPPVSAPEPSSLALFAAGLILPFLKRLQVWRRGIRYGSDAL